MRLVDVDSLKTKKMVIDREPTEAVPALIDDIEWDTEFVIATCGECGKRLLGRVEDISEYFRYCPYCGRKVKLNETN